MIEQNKNIIVVSVLEANPYIDAVEGLIFDPQISGINLDRRTVGYDFEVKLWENFTMGEEKDFLRERWNLIWSLYRNLAERGKEVTEDINHRFGGSNLEKRSSVVALNYEDRRNYHVELNLLGAGPYLQLRQVGYYPQAHLIMEEAGLTRAPIGKSSLLPDSYIPAFMEQQRLLTVHELLIDCLRGGVLR